MPDSAGYMTTYESQKVRENEWLADLRNQLTPVEVAVVHCYVQNPTWPIRKVAKATGCSRSWAAALMRKPEVKAYRDAVLDVNGLQIKQVRNVLQAQMAQISKSNIVDVLDIDDNGYVTIRHLKELPREVQESIRDIQIDNVTTKDGSQKQIIRVRMHDKVRAAELLGRWLGWEVEGKLEAEGRLDDDDQENPVQFVGVEVVAPEDENKEPWSDEDEEWLN